MTRDDATGTTTSRWYFYEEQPGSWRWDLVGATGELLDRSHRVFASRAHCVGDAKSRGYGMPQPAEPHSRAPIGES